MEYVWRVKIKSFGVHSVSEELQRAARGVCNCTSLLLVFVLW